MKLFGRRDPAVARRADAPTADVDLAKRLEDLTARPAPPTPRAPGAVTPHGEGAPAATPGAGGLVAPPDPHVDRLTGLLGPEIFERILVAESARVRRYRRPASLVIAELAGLDALTREWGVEVAASAVASLAEVLRKGSRTSDYVGALRTIASP